MGFVTSVERAVALVEYVGQCSEWPVRLTAISSDLKLPTSTASDLCRTLTKEGLLRRVAEGKYVLGPRVLELAKAYKKRINFTQTLERLMSEDEYLSQRTCVLAVLDGTDVVYVACVSAPDTISVQYDIGLRLPATCTATGKALLAELPDDQVRSLLGNGPLSGRTPNSITSMDELLENLTAIREQGYSFDDEETALGMCCVGAVVLGRESDLGMLSVAVSLVKQGADILEAADHVRSLAKGLSYALAGVGASVRVETAARKSPNAQPELNRLDVT